MFSHLFKLMWNKRRSNGLLFLEILLAFVVLFGVLGFTFYNVERYSSPLGFSYEHSLGVRLDLPDDLDSLGVIEAQNRIKRDLLSMDDIDAVTFIGQINPFGNSNWNTGHDGYGFMIRTQMMFTDTDFAETMELKFREGRWFQEEDFIGKRKPVVINGAFVDEYFPEAETMLDSIFPLDDAFKIVGVVDEFKYQSNFSERKPLTFYPQEITQEEEGGFSINGAFEMLIVRTKPGRTAAAEEPMYNYLVDATKNTDVVIWNMAKDRKKANRPITIPLVILMSISIFLLINIALGLFGVLFTQIARRRAEIGLRKAMGATRGQVITQFVGETILVSVAALLTGTFFAIQVPLLGLVPIPPKYFYSAILVAYLIILTIIIVCSLLPSRQAAKLHPALVLHEE